MQYDEACFRNRRRDGWRHSRRRLCSGATCVRHFVVTTQKIFLVPIVETISTHESRRTPEKQLASTDATDNAEKGFSPRSDTNAPA
jgi:hypothetical protein